MNLIWQVIIAILIAFLLIIVLSDIGNRIRMKRDRIQEDGESKSLLSGDSINLILNYEKFNIYYDGNNYIFRKRK